MKRLVFVFLAVVFISAYAQSQTQSDFYSSWICETAKEEQPTLPSPEYELCQGLLENNIVKVWEAIRCGVNVNNIRLRGTEARTFWRDLRYWYVDNFPESGQTREMVDRFFANPPRDVDLDNMDLSEGSDDIFLFMAAKWDNIDMVRLLLNNGYRINTEILEEIEKEITISGPMKTLLLKAVQAKH